MTHYLNVKVSAPIGTNEQKMITKLNRGHINRMGFFPPSPFDSLEQGGLSTVTHFTRNTLTNHMLSSSTSQRKLNQSKKVEHVVFISDLDTILGTSCFPDADSTLKRFRPGGHYESQGGEAAPWVSRAHTAGFFPVKQALAGHILVI